MPLPEPLLPDPCLLQKSGGHRNKFPLFPLPAQRYGFREPEEVLPVSEVQSLRFHPGKEFRFRPVQTVLFSAQLPR